MLGACHDLPADSRRVEQLQRHAARHEPGSWSDPRPRLRTNYHQGLACLCLSSDPESGKWLADGLSDLTPSFLRIPKLPLLAPVLVRSAVEMPRNWQLLTGFDLITVDMAGGELVPAIQTALVDYLRMGGRLLLLGDPGSPDSVLGRLIGPRDEGARSSQGSRGFGHWMWLGQRSDVHAKGDDLQRWLTATGFFLARARQHSGSAPDEFYKRLDIPGLGQVPVRLFFFLILVFAVVVGPINLLFWRRKKKPQMLLVSVPIAGVAFTTLILIYGFVSEGFDIRGSIRSMTILDQRDHSAANISQRSLFAGMGPDKLDLRPGTHLETQDRIRFWRDPLTHIIDMDLDRGNRMAGTVLPSRTETNLVTWTLSRTRERLAFQRDQSGGYRVIETGGLSRHEASADIVFRDMDGRYWVSSDSGPGLVQDDALATKAMQRLLGMPLSMDYSPAKIRRNRYWYYSRDQEIDRYTPAMKQMREPGRQLKLFITGGFAPSLPRGSYLLRAQVDPAVDDLGLEVRYESSVQLVLGLLAKEDIQ